MSGLYPFINVSIGGRPVSDFFYQRLVSASIHDAPGQDSDSCDLTFDDAGNEIELPSADDIIDVHFGYRDVGGAEKMGQFIVEKPTIEGGDDGEFLIVRGRSAKTSEAAKEALSEHFDDMTIGQIVRQLAGRHGRQAKVDAAYASERIEYVARTGQSTRDFLTRLADRYGALFAEKNGAFLFLQHGQMPTQIITKSDCESWSFEIEPRQRYGKVEAGWFDRATGQTKFETFSTGLEGPVKRVRTLFSTPAAAKAASKGEGERLGRSTGSGSLTLAGRAGLLADFPIVTAGFRPECNGLWRVASIEHSFEDAYTMTVEIEAPEEGKEL
ncbi:MAG: contractile injection system protein, VgrG/Pvc8 family [Rhizobiaceae bacterium]|nr:contractile injection system protein, VgrG/Pvc8 family [Rhizobiaceae bacterium]